MTTENPDGSHLRPGDMAPDFSLADQHGEVVRLQDFRGRNVLIYFYPAAASVDCTAQSCDLRDHRTELTSLGIDVVGISPDPLDKQLAFDKEHGLAFPLLADEDHAVAGSYGVWGDYLYAGTPVTGIVRSSFLIDGDGRISQVWSPVAAKDTVPMALERWRRDRFTRHALFN